MRGRGVAHWVILLRPSAQTSGNPGMVSNIVPQVKLGGGAVPISSR